MNRNAKNGSHTLQIMELRIGQGYHGSRIIDAAMHFYHPNYQASFQTVIAVTKGEPGNSGMTDA